MQPSFIGRSRKCSFGAAAVSRAQDWSAHWRSGEGKKKALYIPNPSLRVAATKRKPDMRISESAHPRISN